ncbi:MAG: carbon-nitrogen hydrolase family protein [Erysipelotrichaceae bacterium]|nr:carbon-nitrogen hydrolase family protein [Erysipelotrichaceae bacterium]
MKVKTGMCQIRVVYDDCEGNLQRAAEAVREAAAQGAEICLLPEALDLGWANPRAKELAAPIPGLVSDRLCALAKENGVWLVSGLTEKSGEDACNAALLISSEGEILLKHRKINILTGVEDVYTPGDRLGTADTPFGRIGIDICADNFMNSLSLAHALARMGARMILSPCSWAVTPQRDPQKDPYGAEWHEPYQLISSLYGIPVIGCSNTGELSAGPWKGWKAIGNSIAYDSDGKLKTVLPYGEDAVCTRVIDIEVLPAADSGTALAERVSRS